jgi:hypothetical protein
MSSQDTDGFLELVGIDLTLQKKFTDDWWRDVSAMAKEQGFEVSRDELQDALRERWGIKGHPVHDDPDTCTLCVP